MSRACCIVKPLKVRGPITLKFNITVFDLPVTGHRKSTEATQIVRQVDALPKTRLAKATPAIGKRKRKTSQQSLKVLSKQNEDTDKIRPRSSTQQASRQCGQRIKYGAPEN